MAEQTNQRKPMPFWLQIFLILLCGAVLSGIVLLAVRSINAKKHPASAEENLPEHTVTFAWQDGTVIDTRQVREGHGVFPPAFETDDVFQGWSTNINEVTSDIEAHPLIYQINDENLFYFNALYVNEGEPFTIDIFLGGAVNISAAKLEIAFDSEVMDLLEHSEDACCTVEETKDGLLTLTLDSAEPLVEKTKLCSIRFMALEKDVYSTKITLSLTDPELVTAGGASPVTGTTINNEIYYLQEEKSQ